MCNAALPTVEQITRLQTEAVRRWHEEPIDAPEPMPSCLGGPARLDGPADQARGSLPEPSFLSLVRQQHACNFRLWHEEDKARSRTASDRQIADVKRTIDQLNQQRNDCIERLDDAIASVLRQAGIVPVANAPLNTETPGSAIDRLSIMSIRIYHYREQLDRVDTPPAVQQSVTQRLSTCEQQFAELSDSLQQLLNDICSGIKRHKTYHQMKMYNDPALNPMIDG
tara:strand:- start:512054 stop:512728 length:675 start_codon:yes stop_codon:yes gene_type:complete